MVRGMMITGDQIKRAREAKGMSQSALAKLIGITQPAIKKIESGQTAQSKWLPQICVALDLPFIPTMMDKVIGVEQLPEGVAPRDLEERGVFPTPLIRFPATVPIFNRSFKFKNDFRPGSIVYESYPVEDVPRPWFVKKSTTAIGLIVPDEDLSPIFEPGDIIIADPASVPIRGKFHVFSSGGPRDLKGDREDWFLRFVKIRRLIGATEEGSIVAGVDPQKTELIPIADYPDIARVLGRVEPS